MKSIEEEYKRQRAEEEAKSEEDTSHHWKSAAGPRGRNYTPRKHQNAIRIDWNRSLIPEVVGSGVSRSLSLGDGLLPRRKESRRGSTLILPYAA